MEYYLIQFEELTGVVESTLGFTHDPSVAKREVVAWDARHAGHRGFTAEDHECASCNARIVIKPIYKLEG